jgi:Cu/Ag efflux protein CusF
MIQPRIRSGRIVALAGALALVAATTLAAAAEETAAPEELGAGSERITLTGTIQQIDYDDREITVIGPSDEVRTLAVSEQVRRFDELRVGDEITVDYEIGVTVSMVPLREGQRLSRAEFAAFEEQRTGEDELPGGVAVAYTEVMATVEKLDRDTRRVTLRGPHRTVTLTAHPDIDLDRVEEGDQVIAAVEEIIAVEVTRTETQNPIWSGDAPAGPR